MEDLLLVLPTVWEMQGVCQALSYAVARAVCSLGRGSWEPGTRGLLGHQVRNNLSAWWGGIQGVSVCPALLVGLFFQQLHADSPLSHQEMLPVPLQGLFAAPGRGSSFWCWVLLPPCSPAMHHSHCKPCDCWNNSMATTRLRFHVLGHESCLPFKDAHFWLNPSFSFLL